MAIRQEARAAAQLRHPNFVSVHEVEREEVTVCIVSDLVQGMSLVDWQSGRMPTPREVAELCATVAEALDHAHQAGVVHRDLKLSNIMLNARRPDARQRRLGRRCLLPPSGAVKRIAIDVIEKPARNYRPSR